MNHEHQTYAIIDGKRVEVVATYDVDGYKPLIYGLFDGETDLTNSITNADYDRIYTEISESVIENMIEAAEMFADMER